MICIDLCWQSKRTAAEIPTQSLNLHAQSFDAPTPSLFQLAATLVTQTAKPPPTISFTQVRIYPISHATSASLHLKPFLASSPQYSKILSQPLAASSKPRPQPSASANYFQELHLAPTTDHQMQHHHPPLSASACRLLMPATAPVFRCWRQTSAAKIFVTQSHESCSVTVSISISEKKQMSEIIHGIILQLNIVAPKFDGSTKTSVHSALLDIQFTDRSYLKNNICRI